MSPNHNTFTVVHLGKKNWSLRHQESLGGTFSHNQCITATLSVLPLYLSSKPSSHLPTLISNFDWLLNYNSFSSCLDYSNTHEDQTACKEITPWKCRQKNSLMPSCRPVYLQPLPSKKFIRQCTVTHRGHVLPGTIQAHLQRTHHIKWHHTWYLHRSIEWPSNLQTRDISSWWW